MTRSLGTMPVWRDVLQLFARWQMLEVAARQEWLGEMREQRPEMYCRLQHMIQADSDAEAQGFTTAEDSFTTLSGEDPDSQLCGMPLGSWILQRPIARGGMGHVWLATRADGLYSGRAAVKLLNALHAGRKRICALRVKPNSWADSLTRTLRSCSMPGSHPMAHVI